MSRALLIDPFSGASGDMLLSALLDAGAPIEVLRQQVLTIPQLKKVKVELEPVARGAFAARQLKVSLPHEHVHRGLSDVLDVIDAATEISDGVRQRARDTFKRLAEVEAKMHGTTVERVHFHEVGALDAILDVVGFYALAENLGVDTFRYTRLVLGSGSTGSAHGEIPVPSPATLELLSGHPVTFSGRLEELVTPTAAAIIATAFEPIGADAGVTAAACGYGAGTRVNDDGLPNVLRVMVGEVSTTARHVAIIRCTIDDMNPELYGFAMKSLFAKGALEVYYTPVQMKKNRPGIELTVICEPKAATAISHHVMTITTTLGVRVALEERVELERRIDQIETSLGPAKVKVALLPGGGERPSPEYETCRELAEKTGRPIAEVFSIVVSEWSAGR